VTVNAYRVQASDGSWPDWTIVEDGAFPWVDRAPGTSITFEVKSFGSFGNESVPVRATVLVEEEEEDEGAASGMALMRETPPCKPYSTIYKYRFFRNNWNGTYQYHKWGWRRGFDFITSRSKIILFAGMMRGEALLIDRQVRVTGYGRIECGDAPLTTWPYSFYVTKGSGDGGPVVSQTKLDLITDLGNDASPYPQWTTHRKPARGGFRKGQYRGHFEFGINVPGARRSPLIRKYRTPPFRCLQRTFEGSCYYYTN